MTSKTTRPPEAETLPEATGTGPEMAAAWTRVITNASEALRAISERRTSGSSASPFDMASPLKAFAEFSMSVFTNPGPVLEAQKGFVRQWSELWSSSIARAIGRDVPAAVTPERGDRRFNNAAWTEQPLFDFLKQAYLLGSRQTLELIAKSELAPDARTRIDFFARQLLNALAPTNYPLTNPEAIDQAMKSGGLSLLTGLGNLLEDVASPSGLVQRRASDTFEIGVTIAATPGKVVFQNALMQLIQYTPTTEQVYRRPLLYVPPLVNKYYMLDLQPKSSLIRWLVEQGHSVFVVSWINPGSDLGNMGIADYVQLGPVAALDAIEQATGERVVGGFAFCMGGILLSMAASYLAGKGQADRIASITTIGTQLDFSHTGEWGTFYDSKNMEALERHLDKTGVIGSEKLQALFSLVRSNDLIWASVVDHYLLDRVVPPSDLLFWFADGAHIPKAFLLEYARQLLQQNLLSKPGGISVDGVPIDLSAIKTPALVISLKDDHVSAWQATYAGAQLLGGHTEFLLGGSGHNAGVINPPSANKHGFWTNPEMPASPEDWMTAAQKQDGSWWPTWDAWLVKQNGGDKVPARTPGEGKLPALEDAPGSYVRMR